MLPVKVAIAGAQGQIGRALLQSVPQGLEVRALSRSDLDITSQDSVMTVLAEIRPDTVVNVAAYTAVDRAESEPELCHRVNSDGARFVALAARAQRARVVHVSTDYVYDGTSTVPYSTDLTPNPVSVYGQSKWRGEQAILGTLGDHATVLRTAWVYSAWGNNFLLKMLQLMSQRGAVSVVADQVGSPTSARSVAQALWQVVLRRDVHGIHHWTDDGVASWYDFAVAIAEEGTSAKLLSSGVEVRPISTSQYPTPARRPRYSVLDTRLTRSALELSPRHWRDNLRETIREIVSA
jgi:dTDP-4-dehydrorhamnose reductase